MTFFKKLPANYTIGPFVKHRFYEHEPYFSFSFTDLEFWQVLEMKQFAQKTPLVLFKNYGFNGETKTGKGTLNISKLKQWEKLELEELEEILGKGMVNFWTFAV